MKPRPVSLLPLLAALGLLLGAAAAGWWQPGCPVRSLTGLKCPGCGAARALSAGAGGRFSEALYWNALFLPAVLWLGAASFRRPWSWRGWLVGGTLALAFGVVRNLPFYLLY